tara:strand:- start:101 stop:511 length:411 start_codon:yes stop_codon:yes gene_type:complete
MFFRNTRNENEDLTKVAALLVHAAKIDENYSETENQIIKKALLEVGANNQNVEKILLNAKKMEENSNQILEFTKEVKNMEANNKIKIVETLWRIIYSNNQIDIYESNLMRRLTGLLYIDNNIMGNIKEKIKNENLK